MDYKCAKPLVYDVIVVEGKYDKNTVLQAVDATVIETCGFSVFNDDKKIALLRKLADKRGLVLFFDSDGAGFLIRGRLKSMLSASNVKQAYIPDIYGKEKRKKLPSKEGKIGVEGMEREVIIRALKLAGATFDDTVRTSRHQGNITKSDLYALGLYGSSDCVQKRRELCRKLNLPERISPNALLDVLNVLYDKNNIFTLLAH